MKFPPETLMAYADGELDAQTRRAIEAEMAVDPQVAQEVERHRAMRAEVGGAFAGVLDEPVPDRLLRAATENRQRTPERARSDSARRRWSWPEWTSIAASLLIGVLAGRAMLQPERESRLVVAESDGRVIAGGALAQALSEQLSSQDRHRDRHRPELSAQDPASTAAPSARAPRTRWSASPAAMPRPGASTCSRRRLVREAGGDYRMASTQLPAPVVQAIAERMQGEALDADEEAIARQRRWRD